MKKKIIMYLTSIIWLVLMSSPSFAETASNRSAIDGLQSWGLVRRDSAGIAHVSALKRRDMFFLQGYVHAQDRLFQMDLGRRQASGTLAELLGAELLPSDIELRTIGVRRAAERSFDALSEQTRRDLVAYCDGVNAYVQKHGLPLEYAAIEITNFEPWVPIDSIVIAKALSLSLSFDTEDILRTVTLSQFQASGVANSFDGAALFFQDLYRTAPFDSASTIPDTSSASNVASVPRLSTMASLSTTVEEEKVTERIDLNVARLAGNYLERLQKVSFFSELMADDVARGSNEWAISGRLTKKGHPLLANDPHLGLTTPSIFYPMQIRSLFGINAVGNTIPGTPSIVLGHNRYITWGSTTNPMDVTDVYQETVVPDLSSPSGLSTIFQGQREHIQAISQQYRVNQIGNGKNDDVVVVSGDNIPAVTLIVPRRNQGPIVEFDQATGVALSIQYTGFSATRELDAFIGFNEARNLEDFKHAVSFFDVGSQNFVYSDRRGNIAYFTSAEIPLREDLEAGFINGLPPSFIRNGSGGNEWLPATEPEKNQTLPYAILPAAEMPQVINPKNGWFVNANNDPAGTTLDNNAFNQLRPTGGIYYLNSDYAKGFRAGRITQLIRQYLNTGDNKISFEEMETIQNDVVLLDAQFFVPHILNAMDRASKNGVATELAALAQDDVLLSAVERLRHWNFNTPTGIVEGYDATDSNGELSEPTQREIDESVAATIYSVWRGQVIQHIFGQTLEPLELARPDASLEVVALRNLLENFSVNNGVGASGLNFFSVPSNASAQDRKDIALLQSLTKALERLRSDEFATAFNYSTNLDDYRWGKLHRIVFSSALGEPFSVPSNGTNFPPPLEGLAGIPTDGGFGVVDASSHSAAAQSENDFMYVNGPANRFVSEQNYWRGIRAKSTWPGGTSGEFGNPNYFNLLPNYLTNDRIPLLYRYRDVRKDTQSMTFFYPKYK